MALGTVWDDVAEYIRSTFEVEKEWPGKGFIFAANGAVQTHRLFLARNIWDDVDHIVLETGLGVPDQVDFRVAALSAGKLLGGVVCDEDLVSLRFPFPLSALTIDHLAVMIGYLTGAAEGYHFASSS